jgi:glycosyltransferase involved in cell wall biosynthesis
LCGPGDSQWLKTLAKEEKVEDQVSFFTDLSEKDLIRLYKASDLYCDASNTVRACLGMSLTEAMAVGMPVVIYDAGGMPEVVFDGKNGFSVPTNDIKALAHALNKVKNLSKKEYEFMGQESVKVAKSMVDINKESNDTLIVLKEIVNSYRK